MALTAEQIDTCIFLLEQGADLHIVNHKHCTPAGLFWAADLSKWMRSDSIERLKCYFEEHKEPLEAAQFSHVHKIVLGLSRLDLQDFLRESSDTIDAVDSDGKTPLAYAAARGDLETVNILLSFGADPNKIDKAGWSPLHLACRSNNPAVSKAVLQAGSDPNRANFVYRETPLHVCCHYNAEYSHIPILLEYGADPSILSSVQESPLDFATGDGVLEAINLLLPVTPSEHHTRALVTALQWKANEALRALVLGGVNVKGVDYRGRTILHYAAEFANEASLLLLSTIVSGISPYARDEDGKTALDFAVQRELSKSAPITKEWWSAWGALVKNADGLEEDFGTLEEDTGSEWVSGWCLEV
jgi:ankyrin repeat protein